MTLSGDAGERAREVPSVLYDRPMSQGEIDRRANTAGDAERFCLRACRGALTDFQYCDALSRINIVLEAALQSERTAAAAAQWQPIETAPKDGTTIIVPGGTACWRGNGPWFSHQGQRYIEWPVEVWQPLPEPPLAAISAALPVTKHSANIKCAIYSQVPPYRMRCERCLAAGHCLEADAPQHFDVQPPGDDPKDNIK